MARYGGKRDINLFRSINRELLHNIIETFVDIYTLAVSVTSTNIYGESKGKTYNIAVRIPSFIENNDPTDNTSEFGKSILQNAKFFFIREDLTKIQLVMTEGDLINWNNKFYEIDHIYQNSYFMNRNPETNKSIDKNFGWNYDLVVEAHLTSKNKTQLVATRIPEIPKPKSEYSDGAFGYEDEIIEYNENYILY